MWALAVYPCRWNTACKVCILFAVVLWTVGKPSPLFSQQGTERLIDLQPFDRITLNEANGNEVIDVLLLEIPDRRSLSALPKEGVLELRRVSEPSVLYKLPWEAIEKIELYEQLVLNKARELTEHERFAEAYSYLEFLHRHYPDLEGLNSVTEQYLKGDALHSFSEHRYDESLSILISLYDLNPQHAGLAEAVQSVADRLISQHLASRDFGAARSVLNSLETAFPQLQLNNIAGWQQRFADGAQRQIELARSNLEQGDYPSARQALRRAAAILPEVKGIRELSLEIERRSPQVVVGVTQHAVVSDSPTLLDASSERVARLTQPKVVELSNYGAEGGIYSSLWADLTIDESGLQLDVLLHDKAIELGVTSEKLTMELVRLADPEYHEHHEIVAALLQDVAISEGNEVNLHWRWPYVKPQALLQFPLRRITDERRIPGEYRLNSSQAESNFWLYESPEVAGDQERLPSIVERAHTSEEEAITDLVRGNIDVLARIAPWQKDRLRPSDDIVTASYRLPTIHVLMPNYDKPLMNQREFRRALCYGIDRQRIVRDIILDGRDHAGFLVLSGPLPAGLSLSDPLSYAYAQEIKPRPYEPRLAAVLATVARTTLAKSFEPESVEQEAESSDSTATVEATASEIEPLIIAYPPDPLAHTTCQTIKLQLDAIGIPVELQEIPANLDGQDAGEAYDLRYAELALWEPLVDMRSLLGPAGLAGNCSPAMGLALKEVDESRNWKEVRTRLQRVHEVAHYDLPVIPLWQTVNFFAYRNSLTGIGDAPISLYQNIAQWETALPESNK